MLRIYLDQNVFSRLAKSDTGILDKVKKLRSKDVILFYSQAHLNDLSSDFTDNKIKELELMREIAEDNFLHIDPDHNSISNALITPSTAFKEYGSLHNNIGEFIMRTFDKSGDPLVDLYIDILKLKPVDLGPDIEAALKKPDDDISKKMYTKLGITKRYYNMGEWLPIVGGMMTKFEDDPKLIKEIRRLSQSHLGVDKFKIKIGNADFDKNLSKSKLGKSFQEMLDQQLGFMSEDLRSYYNEFITGFNMINFLGFDYEKNKKVKFKNTNNDAQHAFFASATDLLVSDDKGLLNKSKFIYNFYGIDTKLLSFNEFVEFVNQYRSREYLNEDLFISQLQIYGIYNLIVASPLSIKYNNEKLEMRIITNKYWKLFDRLLRVTFTDSNDEYFILHPSASRKNNLVFYKEINYIIKSLNGLLNQSVGRMSEEDKKEIKNGIWKGKKWSSNRYDYLLRYDNRIRRLVLQIGPL